MEERGHVFSSFWEWISIASDHSLSFAFLYPMDSDSDVGAGPSQSHHAPATHEETIQLGHTVLLKIPTGDVRTVKLESNAYGSLP